MMDKLVAADRICGCGHVLASAFISRLRHFQLGTGRARSSNDLITAMFRALGREADIEYFDMPTTIRQQYQYFTQANIDKLRQAGYNSEFIPLEEAVFRYVTSFLNQADRYR
jgi:ADP-L-glycero-D-manno-heptose 6-epimerase